MTSAAPPGRQPSRARQGGAAPLAGAYVPRAVAVRTGEKARAGTSARGFAALPLTLAIALALGSGLACAAQAPATPQAEVAPEPTSPTPSLPSPAARDPEPAPDLGAPDPFAPCPAEPADPSAQTPALSLIDLEYDAPYHLLVARESGEWVAAERLPMPRHHASRIDWRNLADFPALADATGRLRFTLKIEERAIQRVAERRWDARYTAVIVAVCRP